MDSTSSNYENGHTPNNRHDSIKNNDSKWFNHLGNFYFERGHLDEAITAYQSGLKIERQNLNLEQNFTYDLSDILVTLSNLGEAYRRRGDYLLALEKYKELLQLQHCKYGVFSHPDVVKTLHVIGLIYDEMKNLPTALEYINCVLAIQMQQRQESDMKNDEFQDISTALTHAGCILYRMNHIDTAIENFEEALALQKMTDDDDSLEIAFTLYHLGLCHQAQGCYEEAINCFIETLHTEEKLLGPNHNDLIATMIKLGEVYVTTGMLDQALPYYEKALRIERQHKGTTANRSDEVRILLEIGYIFYFQGENELVKEILSEISGLEKTSRLQMGQNNSSLFQYLQMLDVTSRSVAPAA
mmetsp:Transcript_1959/g.2734  ORF Transcript_1959/g.2734 Transcript_1959/m.2734 type:complete len:356 (+) Transcript_1959:61-1128(+)